MRASRRVVGIDLARCLALVGMMATHVLPGVVDGQVPLAHQVAGGRASALFAVLAGASLVLVAGDRAPLHGPALRGMLAGTLVRSTLLGLVGLLIGGLDSGIAVILTSYALLFLLAVPFLALSSRALVWSAACWAVAGPLLSLAARRQVPGTDYTVPDLESLASPVALARDLLLTGYYPVATWLPYLLVGIVVGRLDLRRASTSGVLAGVGLALVCVAVLVSDALLRLPGTRAALTGSFDGAGWQGDLATTLNHGLYGVVPTGDVRWLAVRAAHTGTTFDLLMTTGSALLVLAVCLPLGRLAPRVLSVASGAGAMTLTLYTLHVVLRADGLWDGEGTDTLLGQVVLVLAIGAVFRVAGRRGPLETLVGEASGAVRRAVSRRARPVDRVGSHD